MTTVGGSPMPYSSDANERRKPWGVSAGSGGSPASANRSLAPVDSATDDAGADVARVLWLPGRGARAW
jgi:hypothetical protein